MVLIFQRVTPIVSPLLPTPVNLEVIHGHRRETDARKPHHHRQFSERSDLLSPCWRGQAFVRVCPRLRAVPRLSAETQGPLQRRWGPDTPLALCPCPPGWRHHLAAPMHHVQSRLHRPAAFYLALPPDATGGRARCALGDPWRPELGAVCGVLSSLPDGPLSSHLGVRPSQSGHGAHPVWAAAPGVFPGG